MPIGKNAIKRVSNNGYSKVSSFAPDMENSTVSEEKKESTPKKAAPVSNKVAAKKAEPKKKSTPAAKSTPKKEAKPAKKAAEKPAKTTATPAPVLKNEPEIKERIMDNGCINIGGEMPIYLL